MKKSILGMIIPLFLAVCLLGTSCSGDTTESTTSSTSTDPETAAIREYADPATETTLQGLSENDYAKYIQYFNAEAKASLSEQAFAQSVEQINNQLGKYISKSFLSAEEQTIDDNAYIIVHYSAKYEKGDFKVRMVFDQNRLVAGQWFE
jgi:hypothetical protein